MFSRRRFLQSAAVTASSLIVPRALAQAAGHQISVVSRVLEVKGRAAKVFGLEVAGSTQGLSMDYGGVFRATVHNKLSEATLVHWHGLTPPPVMDGVPMLSGPMIDAGQSRDYAFDTLRSGTHWMHSHVGLQEQSLLAAPLIIRETGDKLVDEQEHVVMLHDFTFRDPAEILAELQGGGGMHAGHDMAAMGGGMVSDIAYDAMLANDRTLDDPEVVQSEKAGRFKLRIINGAAATNCWVDLGNIVGELIAVDGNAVYPVKGSRFPLGIAQRADIRLALPAGSGAWPILFVAEGSGQRSGVVLRSGDGAVVKLADTGKVPEPVDLSLEVKLKSVAVPPETSVSRTEIVTLTGGGGDYVWGLNGKASMHDVIFNVREGERYEIVMQNLTGMAHPMHLHGHYFKVVGIDGKRINGAIRDTVIVPVGAQVAIQFDADNPGTWAFHCHHLYHMNAGMMGAIAYVNAA